ncbi:MAG: hypothetical protein CMH28_03330 [Micavibrio sp.]|nr:hypothetical protein [Micavibrio sp.]|tara:strand:- start:75 stop:575 length:501 start_codon:yes stop_codon:yes gene_type:complete
MSPVSIIVAASQNNVIGRGNELVWHIPEDFRYFKEKTSGKPCIMGRKTFQSILDQLGKPLPKRTNIVVTRSDYEHKGAISCHSLEAAINQARSEQPDEIMICGGQQIYKQALEDGQVDKIYLTRVLETYEGDAFFPELDEDIWQKTEERKSETTSPPCLFQVFEKT